MNYFFYLFIGFGVAIAMMRRREAMNEASELKKGKAERERAPFRQPRALPV